jgi:hypothetical protein
MNKCEKCHHDCHCVIELHSDEYGVCTCDYCECKDKKTDLTYEDEVKHE